MANAEAVTAVRTEFRASALASGDQKLGVWTVEGISIDLEGGLQLVT